MAAQREVSAFVRGAPDLVLEAIAQVAPRERPDLRFSLHRVPDLEISDAVDEALFEFVCDALDHNEALGGDTALARVLVPGAHAGLRGGSDIGVGQHDKRVGAAQLENGLLESASARRADLAAGDIAAGEGDCADAGIVDQRLRLLAGGEQCLENALRKTGRAECLLNGERTLGDVRGVFEEADVARHESGSGKAKHLPERKVPRHDCQHRAQRLERDVALGRIGGDALRLKESLSVVGVEVAVPGTFLDLCFALDDGLSHLSGNQSRQARLFLAQV